MTYDWDFSILAPYRDALLKGAGVSILLALYSSVIGTVIGIALGGIYEKLPMKGVFLFLNDALRSLPPLVAIFFFYFFPYRALFGIYPPSAFLCATAALALSQAVFTAELVRAAKATVPQAPILAAQGLGVSEGAIWWHVVFPDILRQILPALIAFWIGNLKLSSLASVIGVEEVVFVAKVAVGQQFRTLEAWVAVAIIYMALVLPFTLLARRIETSDWIKRRA